MAADVLRRDGTQQEAADAAERDLSTIKRWLKDPEFQAMVASSPDIRPGRPPRRREESGAESQSELRCRMWIGANGEVLGSYLPGAAVASAGTVLHVHVVPADAVDAVRAAIDVGACPADSPYIPVLLDSQDELLDNLPLVCRLGSRMRARVLWLGSSCGRSSTRTGARGHLRTRCGRASGASWGRC